MRTITFIVFGGTGDLMRRKLAHAIANIAKQSKEIKYNIIGVGRTEFNDKTYKEFLLKSDRNVSFGKNVELKYYQGDVTKKESMKGLEKTIESSEENPLGRIFYLATSQHFFEDISKIIRRFKKNAGFTRIMIEKPFGHSLSSFRKLNNTLSKYFDEEQIYRVDHYLAKETVENILLIRFSNPLFENTWNSKFVDKIKIIISEDTGVEKRMEYYDAAGAIRDMVQNHILQVLLFILMDAPKVLDTKNILEKKHDAIKNIYFSGEVIRGQYEGYKEEAKKIRQDSETETYVQVELMSKSKRWKGTKIILATGKNLKEKDAHITLEYKKEPCILYCSFNTAPNKLIFRIQPSTNVEFTMNAKKPGAEPSLEKVRMMFNPATHFKANTVNAYETILAECIKGDKRLFICSNILQESWKITDKIIRAAKTKPLIIYKKGSEPLKWN